MNITKCQNIYEGIFPEIIRSRVDLISYIKILGPPVKKAIDKLEEVTIDLPQICIMDKFMIQDLPQGHRLDDQSLSLLTP